MPSLPSQSRLDRVPAQFFIVGSALIQYVGAAIAIGLFAQMSPASVAGRAQLRSKSDELVGVTQLECRRHGVSAPLDATSHLCEENVEVHVKPTKGRIRRTLVDPRCGRLKGELCGTMVRILICKRAGEMAFESRRSKRW